MCGIVGTVGRLPEEPVRRQALSMLEHRGPDGGGEHAVNRTWLGHRRLAIIDLSNAASQPMESPGAGVIAFNGEIYDHLQHRKALAAAGVGFETESDTEVLLLGLAREGPEFTSGLHGMWAFAFLRAADGCVLLGRDHAGLKPLYVFEGEGYVAFASELRALQTILLGFGENTRSSRQAVAEALRYGSVSEPHAFLRGVTALPPDSVWTVTPSGVVIERREVMRRVERTKNTRDAVEIAVQRHLVADVPVSLFLSSGVDSSVIAAAAARSDAPKPTAITVALESQGTRREPAVAGRLARRLGLRHVVVPMSDWRRKVGRALEAYDHPSIDGINTFLVASVARELGFKVALSGVGADEVYGGYAHFRSAPRWRERLSGPWALQVARAGRFLAFRSSIRGRRLACMAEGARLGEPSTRSARRVLPESFVTRLMPGIEPANYPSEGGDLLELERETYLKDTLLRDTDAMGMANGVEIRAPFLDPDVLEDAARIGSRELLAAGRRTKWPLRDSWLEELERETRERGKTGFTLRLDDWLTGDGAPIVEEALDGFERRRVFDRHAAGELVAVARRNLKSRHPAAPVLTLLVIQIERAMKRFGEP